MFGRLNFINSTIVVLLSVFIITSCDDEVLSEEESEYWFLKSESLDDDDYLNKIKCYSKSLELDSSFRKAEILISRGRAHQSLSHYDSSLADFNLALKIYANTSVNANDWADLYLDISNLKYELEEYKSSIDFCNLALNFDDGFFTAEALNLRGLAQTMLKEDEKAISDFQESLSLFFDPIVMWNLAAAYGHIELYELAISSLDKCLAALSEPDDSIFIYDCKSEKAGFKYDLGDYKNSIEDLNSLLRQNPDDLYNIGILGRNYFKTEQYYSAIREFEKILEKDSSDVSAHYWKGKCLYNLNDYESAIIFLSNSISLDDSNLVKDDALFYRAKSKESLGYSFCQDLKNAYELNNDDYGDRYFEKCNL